jgi:hypothetical protein
MSLQTRLSALITAIGADIKALNRAAIIPIVTVLPSAPVDGQECVFLPDPTDATGNGGVAWRLKYRQAEPGPYKWYCIGGDELFMEVLGLVSTTATSPTDLGGPALDVPLAGDYSVHHGRGQGDSTGGTGWGYSGITSAYEGFTKLVVSNWVQSGSDGGSYARKGVLKNLTQGDYLRMDYWTSQGQSHRYSNRFLAIRPRRVGKTTV